MGNPFPCEMIDRTSDLDDSCQFIDQPAAYHRAGDGEAVPCCKNCKNPCEHICSRAAEKWEVATSQEKVVYANRAYIKASPYNLPKFDLQEVLGYLREKEQELDDFVSAGNIPEKTITRMKMTVEGLKLLAALTLAPIAEDVQNE